MKRAISVAMVALLALGVSGCVASNKADDAHPNAHVINLSDTAASLDGKEIAEYDYTWSLDVATGEESYSGEQPSDRGACYIAHDIVYYPELDEKGFVEEKYDGETEWVYKYAEGKLAKYVFSTLPYFQNGELPTQMMYSADEAYDNKVLHITQPGEYVLEGEWHGQIWVDLGDKDEAFSDESAKVTLVMSGADVTCDVAPALVFYSAYECDNGWEDQEEHGDDVDLSNAGAKVVLADGTENSFTGANVYRLLKPEYKKEGSDVQKKRWKMDGAFYSFVSMLIEGEEAGTGILNVTSSTYEGLDSELHLTINSGYINIVSQDDGINVNEDGVSVLTVNGGRLTIFAGQGAEGDVVDSNGFIRVNGGVVAGCTPSPSDNILDSDSGTTMADNAIVINGSGSHGMEGGPGGPDGERPEFPDGRQPGQGEQPPAPPDGQRPKAQ